MKKNREFFLSTKTVARILLSPTVVLLLSLTMFPFLFSLYMSFCHISVLGGIRLNWIGIKNWAGVLTDERFWNSLNNTARMALIATSIEYVAALILAVLVEGEFLKGKRFFRVSFIIPMMLMPIGIGFLWRMIFTFNAGPLNDILTNKLGLPFIGWLSDPKIAPWTIIIADVWQWTPFVFLFLTAGLQLIPIEIIESARVDGASPWQIFSRIQFPLLLPITFTVLLIRFVEAFKILDKVFIITGGGPGMSTETTTMYAYIRGIRVFQLGYGSAIAYLFFLVLLGCAIILVSLARKIPGEAQL